MADPSLNNPVIIQATRLDASILPVTSSAGHICST